MYLRTVAVGMVLGLVAIACGGSPTDDTVPDVDRSVPSAVVRAWLDALADPSKTDPGSFVEPTSLAVVAAIENGLDAAETAALISSGLDAATSTAYWMSFAEDFATFSDRPAPTLRVGDWEEVEGMEGRFAAVEVGAGDETTDVLLVKTDDGWRIDLVATLGPGLVGLMADAFDDLRSTPAADAAVAAYRSVVEPALTAAIAHRPTGAFVAAAARLIVAIESVDPPG